MHTLEEAKRFAQLAPHEKIEARIAWLEKKMVELLWLMISLTSFAFAAVVTYLSSELLETRSPWVLAPVAIVVWLVSGWVVQRQAFRGAPPHIDFIDP